MQHVAGRAMHVEFAVAVAGTEDGKHARVAAQQHGDALGTAFLIAAAHGAEDAAKRLVWLVPLCDRPPEGTARVSGVLEGPVAVVSGW